MSFSRAFVLLLFWRGACCVSAQTAPAQLPDAPNREPVQRICSGCHPATIVLGRGMTREQWGGIVSNMISRGAKGSDEDFAAIVDYLATNLPPGKVTSAASNNPQTKATRPPNLLDEAGPNDKPVVDDEAAARGKAVYLAECVTCHGTRARGSERGPDLIRSLVVLHDRYGSTIGPYMAQQHPDASSLNLSHDQIVDLSNFLHQQLGDTLRTGPYNNVLNVLVGDAREGKAYFYGPGKCSQCHSTSGDLAHIGSKYDPAVLQLKVVFPQTAAFGRRSTPNSRKPVMVTVSMPDGQKTTGVLGEIDDFSVSLQDAAGNYHTFARGPGVKVEKHDPYAEHEALLDQYTDKDIHDVVAYLETFK